MGDILLTSPPRRPSPPLTSNFPTKNNKCPLEGERWEQPWEREGKAQRPKGGSASNIPNSQDLNPRAIDPAALERRASSAFVSRAHNTSSKDVYVFRKENKWCRLSGRAVALHHIWLGRWWGVSGRGAAPAPGPSGWSDTEGLNMVQPRQSLRAGC